MLSNAMRMALSDVGVLEMFYGNPQREKEGLSPV